jgi:uncharacterized BrkB/YihY/UPF0761 family membrane protein
MNIDWTFVLVVVLVTTGFLQWAKALVRTLPPNPGETTWPNWVWAIVMPLLCALFSFLFVSLPPWAVYGACALAAAQLGYDNIVKLVQKKIDQLGGG